MKAKTDWNIVAVVTLAVVFVGVTMGLGMAEVWFFFGGKPL